MRYPQAQWLGNGQSGGSYTGGPHRLVIHTTETSGLPSYQSGATAPHITYDPETGTFYQHTDFNVAARALANVSGGVQTNRRSALQIEVICYSAKSIADQAVSRVWVGDLTDNNFADLREFIAWCGVTFGIDETWPGKQAFSFAEANKAGFRMTGTAWDAFGGVCGHQHVPENTHWDPGAIDWNKLLPTTQLLEDEMTPADKAEILAAIAAIPNATWKYPQKDDPAVLSTYQLQSRTKEDTTAIRLAVGALELEGVSEADLDERVAELVTVISAQPAKFVAALKAAL